LTFIVGFLVWIALGVVAGVIMPRAYKAAGTEAWLAIVFGICGAFIGGMLGSAAHVYHDATPLRIGGLLGAIFGAAFFTFLYNFMARKAI
jgi:uncharacterized membrane protein YeaQ/YmgE (transglycosylase-associated protein family)